MVTVLMGVLIVGVSVFLSLVGLVLVRRSIPLSFLETHHEVAGFFIGVLGTIYAVFLAFVVYVVWSQFEDVKITVEREASQLGDILRISEGFPDPIQRRVKKAVHTYARLVIDDEWSTMSRGEASPRAQVAMDRLWQVYEEIEPKTARESALYAKMLDLLTEVGDSRKLRLHASHEDIPIIIKALVWGGGLITVVFTYFFGVKNIKSQALMTAALTAEIAFVLFLIAAIDNPFRGDVRITPEPFQHVLEKVVGENL